MSLELFQDCLWQRQWMRRAKLEGDKCDNVSEPPTNCILIWILAVRLVKQCINMLNKRAIFLRACYSYPKWHFSVSWFTFAHQDVLDASLMYILIASLRQGKWKAISQRYTLEGSPIQQCQQDIKVLLEYLMVLPWGMSLLIPDLLNQ